MKKRVLSLVLTLCMLLGLLPTAALAATAAETPAEIAEAVEPAAQAVPETPPDEPGEAATLSALDFTMALGGDKRYYHNGGDLGAWVATDSPEGRGGFDGKVWLNGHTIHARERARYRNANYLMEPFQITVNVPAYTRRTVTFETDYDLSRNSKGSVWYWVELLKYGTLLGCSYNAKNTSNGSVYSTGRVIFNNEQGGTATRTFTLTFENKTATAKDVSEDMTYYVGVSKSGSILSKYHHQLKTSTSLSYQSHIDTPYVATVDNKCYTNLTEAVEDYNAKTGLTLTLLTDVTGNVTLTKPGALDLGGKTLTGRVTVGAGDVTVKNGNVTAPSGNAVTHSGSGALTLTGVNVTARDTSYYGVKNTAGTLILNSDVTIHPDLFADGAVTLKDGGPTISGTSTQLYLHAPITLTGALDKSYQVKLYGVPTVEDPVTVAATGASAQNAGKFTDRDGKYPIFLENGKIVARPYKITFDPAGGTVSPTSTYVKSDGTAAAWPTPAKSGYTFVSWGRTSTGFTGDTTLTARWTPAHVTVKFDANGGTSATSSKDYSIGGKYADLPTATRTGYTFKGWYTAPSGGTKVDADTDVTNTGAHTLYAQWTRVQYTVTFDHGDGNKPYRNIYAGSPVGTLPATRKTGYTLSPWRTSAGGGTTVTASTVPTGDVTYYAKWVANTYTVTLDPQGGTVSTRGKSVTYASTYGALPTPTKTGYTFGGWYTAASGGTQVTADTTVAITANQTLYAQWTANKIKLTFKLNGGTISTSAIVNVTFDAAYGTLPTPTRVGYTFAGWWTAPAGGTEVTADTIVTNPAAHALYAHWTAKTTRVVYRSNYTGDGTGNYGETTCTYDQPYVLPTDPEREGYTFLGWFNASRGGEQITPGTIYRQVNVLTDIAYAHWRPANVTVTLNRSVTSGTVTLDPDMTSFIVPYGKPYGEGTYGAGNTSLGGKLPVATRTGTGAETYSFVGWYDAQTGGNQVTATTLCEDEDGAVTLYARWTTLHQHPIDGGRDYVFSHELPASLLVDGTGAAPDGVTVDHDAKKITLAAGGQYYLEAGTDPINAAYYIEIPNCNGGMVCLCLNGRTISYTGEHPVINAVDGSALNVCDCKGTGTVIQNGSNVCISVGSASEHNAIVCLYDAAFTAKQNDCIDSFGRLYITNCAVKSEKGVDGNAVESYGTGASITINSGRLEGNRAVWVGAGTTVTINGGTLVSTGNHEKADDGSYQQACGIMNWGGTLNFSGGTLSAKRGIMAQGPTNISGDAKVVLDSPAWGVYVYNTTLTMTGGAVESPGVGVVSNGDSGVANISGGSIAGGNTDSRCAGVSVSSSGTANISGGNITGYYGLHVEAGTATLPEGSTAVITGTTNQANQSGNPARASGVHIANGGTLNMHGGTVTAHHDIANQEVEGINCEGTLNLTGGTVNPVGICNGVRVEKTGTATISGAATVNAYCGVGVDAGTGGDENRLMLTIQENANITGSNTGVNVVKGKAEITGGAITAGNATTRSYTISTHGATTISGGTVTNTGTSNSFPLYVGGGTTTVSGAAHVSGFGGAYVAAGTLNVDGGSITSTGSAGINTATGTTVNVTNGTVTGSVGGILVNSTATVSGGTVTGNLRGVQVNQGGTLNVTGGAITAAKPSNDTRGYGIEVGGGTATVSGGTIIGDVHGATATHNSDKTVKGALTITGGTVTGKGSAGVYMNDADLTVTGGKISGLVGVYMGDECPSFILGGTPTIDGGSRHCDIGLGNGKVITVSTGATEGVPALDANAQFSVAMGVTQPAEGSPVAITTANTADESNHFTAHDPAQGVQNSADNVVQLYIPHKHSVGGGAEAVEFFPLTATGGDLAAGNYYLTETYTFNGTGHLVIPAGATVNLCLNGQTMEFLKGGLKILGALNLCDCGTDGKVTVGGSANSIAVLINGGTLNQYGGTLEGKQYPAHLAATGAWNFYGGTLAATDSTKTATIQPLGQLNALDDLGTVQIELTNETKPIHIGAKPAAAYSVTTTVYPVTVADGLPQDAAVGDYFTCDNNKLELTERRVTLRTFRVTVDGGDILSADASGKLTQAQLTAAKGTNVGYTWGGFYTAAEGGDAVTADTVFSGDTTIYPRWTECAAHEKPTGEGAVTTVASTCTEAGSETYVCAKCAAPVTVAIPATGHDVADVAWSKDEGKHWKVCKTDETHLVDEAGHEWGSAPTDADKTAHTATYTCTVCGQTHTEAVPTYTLTYVKDAYSTGGPTDPVTAEAGDPVALPDDLTRTGYALAGWAPEGDETGTVLTGTYTVPAQDVTLRVLWQRVANYQLQPGETMVLEDGATVTNDSDATVTITQPDVTAEDGSTVTGGQTVITLPEGTTGGVTVTSGDGKDKVTVPSGSTVVTTPGSGTQGPTITIGGGDGKVDGGGAVEAGAGTTVAFPDGNKVEITDGSGVINSDGNVSFPPAEDESGGPIEGTGGGTVEVTTGTPSVTTHVDVDGRGEGIDAETGKVAENGPDDQVKLPDGTVVTVPDPNDPAKSGVTDHNDGSTTVPAGSQVDLPDGSAVTLDDAPGTVDQDGNVTVPAGGTATITDDKGHQTTVAPGAGGDGVITPTGDIELPEGGTVTVEDGEGGHTTITAPTGGTVTITDLHGNETTVTLPEGTTTVTVDSKTGEVTLPAGSQVTKPNGDKETVGEGGGTVKPDGTVTQGGDTPTPPAPAHTHAVSVGCETDSGDQMTFQALTSDADHNLYIDGVKQDILSSSGGYPCYVLSGGSYYLADDVTLSNVQGLVLIKIGGAVDLCLNGHTLDLGGCYIAVEEVEYDLKLCDCGAGGVITSAYTSSSESEAVIMMTNGAFAMYGGTVKNTGVDSEYVSGHQYHRALAFYHCQPSLYAGTVISDHETAVYMGEIDRLTLGGNVTITGADDKADIDWRGGTFVLTEPLNNTKPYRVTTAEKATLTSGWTAQMGDADFSGYFTCVAPGFTIEKNADGELVTVEATTPEHTHSYGDWSKDGAKHWHACTAADCPDPDKGKTDEAGHAYTDDTDATCDVCGYERTVTPPQSDVYTVTFDTMGGEPVPAAQTVTEGETATEPDAPAKTGYTFKGWFTQATGGMAWQFNTDPVTEDITLYAQWAEAKPSATVTPDNPVELPGGGSVTKDPDTGDVTITTGGEGGSTTTVTPGEGDVTVDEDGTVTVPGGSTVKPGNGTEITVPGGSTLDPATGDITVPGGSTVTIPDGNNGKTEITVPAEGGQTVSSTGDGVKVPEGSTVTTADGATLTVTEGAGTVAPDGTVTLPEGGEVTIEKDGETTTVTVTPGGSVSPDYTAPTPPAPSRPSSSHRPSGYTPSIQQPDHGEVTVSPIRPTAGDKVTVTVTPDEGCEVDTVTVTDRNGKPVEVTRNADGAFTFTQPTGAVTVSVTIAATVKEASCPKDGTCPAASFTDLDLAQWYHDGIHFCVGKGLMRGTDQTTFAPEMPASRVMIAVILWRLEGSPTAGKANGFDDVAEGTWYAQAVAWTARDGIVEGYGNGKFGPDDAITREQLATMLWRYAKAVGRDVSAVEHTLGFADADEASQWAIAALRWTVKQGILTGKDGNLLDPKGQATRAEVAAMLQRFCQSTK